MECNDVLISGTVISQMTFSHATNNERFYLFYLSCKRQSSTIDIIPVIVSEWLIDYTKEYKNTYVEINGSVRSHNQDIDGKRKLIIFVFANKLSFPEEHSEDKNEVILTGCICKEPINRQTPLGRNITDLFLSVNRIHGTKTDYIPCVAWGRMAQIGSGMHIGSFVSISGRIQSRIYTKGENEKTAIEISIGHISQGNANG